MLTLDRAFWSLPVLVQVGLALLLVGGAGDLAAHLGAAAGEHEHGFSVTEVAAHLVVFVGMALTLLGVVVDGALRDHPDLPAGDTTRGGV